MGTPYQLQVAEVNVWFRHVPPMAEPAGVNAVAHKTLMTRFSGLSRWRIRRVARPLGGGLMFKLQESTIQWAR